MDNVIHEALTKGLELQKSGQSALAKQLYLSTLQLAPRHSKANHLLGKLEIQCGNFDQAEEFLRISLESNLKSIYCWIDYITVLVQLNEIEVAQQLYFLAQLHDFTEDEISILRKRFETSEFKACSLLRRVKHTAASGTQSPSLSIIEKLEDHYSKRNYITLFKLCFKLVHEYTRSAEIWNFLGASSLHLGSNEDAIYAFKKVTKIRPNNADSFKNLAIGLKKSGALNEAIKNYEKAIKINPDDYHAYNSIGTILDEQGRLNEALKFYKKAVSINQKDINSQNNLGLTYHRLRQYKDAVDTFNLAISLSPNIAQLYNNLGNSQKSQHENYKAMENYNKALQLLPEYQEAQMNKGHLLHQMGLLDEALDCYSLVLKRNLTCYRSYNYLGAVFLDKGDLLNAKTSFERALEINPSYAGAYRNLVDMQNGENLGNKLEKIDSLIFSTKTEEFDRSQLLYAKAKILESSKKFKSAFDALVEGGRIRKKLSDYKVEDDIIKIQRIKNFAAEIKRYSINQELNTSYPSPIFILGMPRSGTTLTEQIISCHSKVQAGGELPFIEYYGSTLAHGVAEINQDDILSFANSYRSKLLDINKGAQYVTDKMPDNFRYIGLIFSAFPDARIIHVRRNAQATCWSCFKHFFGQNGIMYSYSLFDVVKYYECYRELMEFWDEQYVDRIYHLEYEMLTADPITEIKKISEFLNLPWENRMLSPHKNSRSVRTASQQQVRKKIYKGSSESWRRYEPYLTRYFESLKGHA